VSIETLLDSSLERIRQAPSDAGVVEMIVRRPADDMREVLEEGWLDQVDGLKGDIWPLRIAPGLSGPDPEAQITIVNARASAAIAGDRERWPLAGDQLYIDFDISETNAPAGTRIQVGDAVLEFSAKPHTGCKKFSGRFGLDALAFVSSPIGRQLRLRGANCRVVISGVVRPGDRVVKL
jgi:hypothetical protein